MTKSVVHVSGGLDSAASFLLSILKSDLTDTLIPVFYSYGQPYLDRELNAADKFCVRFGRTLKVYQIPLLIDQDYPVKAYVPYRNLILCAHSLNVAVSLGAQFVVTGSKSVRVKENDIGAFKDSSFWPFTEGLNKYVETITESDVVRPEIVMPLAGWTKKDVIKCLLDNAVDPDSLWTCYGPGPEPCGNCRHCKEYRKAREALGLS